MTQSSIQDIPGSPFDDDKLHEECGVFGIYGHEEAGALAALGLHALQHRGQEAAGIVSHDGHHFHSHRAMGKVGDNFSSEDVINSLKGFPPSAITDMRQRVGRCFEMSSRFSPILPMAVWRSAIMAT